MVRRFARSSRITCLSNRVIGLILVTGRVIPTVSGKLSVWLVVVVVLPWVALLAAVVCEGWRTRVASPPSATLIV